MKFYKHKRTGNLYGLLFTANDKATRSDFVRTAVYEDEKGIIWARPYTEFVDKFEYVYETTYWVDTDTGKLEPFCVCVATCKNECNCGVWDDEETK